MGSSKMVSRLITALFILAFGVSVQAVDIPNTFSNGTVADADQVNENFTALKNGINDVNNSVDGYLEVTISGGGTMFVRTIEHPFNSRNTEVLCVYRIKTTTGVKSILSSTGQVDKGMQTRFYYASSDCSGTPYVSGSSFNSTNPYILDSYSKIRLLDNGNELYYIKPEEGYVTLNHNSYGYVNGSCTIGSNTITAFEAHENNPSITGITTYPIVITEPDNNYIKTIPNLGIVGTP